MIPRKQNVAPKNLTYVIVVLKTDVSCKTRKGAPSIVFMLQTCLKFLNEQDDNEY